MTATENILGLSGYDAATLNTVANAVADGLVGPGEWMPLSVRYRVAAKVLDALAEQSPSGAEVEAAAVTMCATGHQESLWGILDETERDSFRDDARAALVAARKAQA